MTGKFLKENYEILTDDGSNFTVSNQAIRILKQYDKAEEQIAELEEQVKAVKQSLYDSMMAHNVLSVETEDFKFTCVPPTDTLVINTEKLKEEGVYDYYRDKKSHRNGYVKYTRKKKAKAE